MAEAVRRNGEQLRLNFGPQYRLEAAPRARVISARMTLILLMSTVRRRTPNEPDRTEYCAEISTPATMTRRRVTEWYERILLPSMSDDSTPEGLRAPEAPPELGTTAEIDIPVPRRKGA